jgi:hypothetical protein
MVNVVMWVIVTIEREKRISLVLATRFWFERNGRDTEMVLLLLVGDLLWREKLVEMGWCTLAGY